MWSTPPMEPLRQSHSCAGGWRSRSPGITSGGPARNRHGERREELKDFLIKKAFDDSDGTYGYRRVWWQLARWGVRAGLELVRALMRELDLVACQPRPWRPATTATGIAGPIPDLVNRDFTAAAPGRKMVGDITYIPTWEGWVYLATVIDCATRKVTDAPWMTITAPPLIASATGMAARKLDLLADARFSIPTVAAIILQASSPRRWTGLLNPPIRRAHRSVLRQRACRIL